MILGHKIEMEPSKRQEKAMVMACGVARYTWNWALAEWKREYKAGGKPNALSLKRRWNQEKPYWVYLSPKGANQRPFTDLSRAFKGFFSHRARYPQVKRKGRHDSFYVENDKFLILENRVRLPKIGWVELTEGLRFEGKIVGGVVSREADRWFIAVQVAVGNYQKGRDADGVVGVDLGVRDAAVLSTGERLPGPKPLRNALRALKRRQRGHSRKVKGSSNRKKSAVRLARLHWRIGNQRKDWLHKVTTRLCRENQTVVIEDLNVTGMLKNHKLARSISDIGFGEFRRQLGYKSKIFGTELIVADRFFPSTKMCWACGRIKDMPLSERVYRCECGYVADRDLNAAMNLSTLGYRGIYACGEGGSGLGHTWVKPFSKKQELEEHLCALER
jgi:putative transposase